MASGQTLLTFHPYQNEPPSSNYMTLDTRNGHPCLDADATTTEAAIFTGILPRNYAGGGITVYVHYAMSSATSGNVKAQTSFERIGDGQQDIDSDGFATAVALDDQTVPGTSGHVDILAIAHTNGAQIDSIAVGEAFRLKVEFPSATTSNASGDRELVMVELKES